VSGSIPSLAGKPSEYNGMYREYGHGVPKPEKRQYTLQNLMTWSYIIKIDRGPHHSFTYFTKYHNMHFAFLAVACKTAFRKTLGNKAFKTLCTVIVELSLIFSHRAHRA
jgi:hypothetical protein